MGQPAPDLRQSIVKKCYICKEEVKDGDETTIVTLPNGNKGHIHSSHEGVDKL